MTPTKPRHRRRDQLVWFRRHTAGVNADAARWWSAARRAAKRALQVGDEPAPSRHRHEAHYFN